MFKPNYRNMVDCAFNRKPERIALYDHSVADVVIEKLTGQELVKFLIEGDLDTYFKRYCQFFEKTGYDTVSFEAGVVPLLEGGGALTKHIDPAISTMEDLEKYPFEKIVEKYKKYYTPFLNALRDNMPEGMKAVGGVGFGVFEVVQDLVGFENLCIISFEDEELFKEVFIRVGNMMLEIWKFILSNYNDVFCVYRFGDDLGYRSNTMLTHDQIRINIIPQYKKIISTIKQTGKPFLLHSCGCIFDVMEDLIAAGINAKHSNEDAIAPFSKWVELYGDRIANFGGIDTDRIVRGDKEELRKVTFDVYERAVRKNGGIAIGSGNSIAPYVDPERYMIMVNTVRKARGDFDSDNA